MAANAIAPAETGPAGTNDLLMILRGPLGCARRMPGHNVLEGTAQMSEKPKQLVDRLQLTQRLLQA
jgi:hypothetical protein